MCAFEELIKIPPERERKGPRSFGSLLTLLLLLLCRQQKHIFLARHDYYCRTNPAFNAFWQTMVFAVPRRRLTPGGPIHYVHDAPECQRRSRWHSAAGSDCRP
ncbi:unnamed protein product [Ectocarpus sp. 8 AP-2014]